MAAFTGFTNTDPALFGTWQVTPWVPGTPTPGFTAEAQASAVTIVLGDVPGPGDVGQFWPAAGDVHTHDPVQAWPGGWL